jgi:hypothetical protein
MYRKPPGMIAGTGPPSGDAPRKPMKGDACKPAPSNLGMGPGTTSEPRQESLLEMGLSLGLGLGLNLKARSLMPFLRPTGLGGMGFWSGLSSTSLSRKILKSNSFLKLTIIPFQAQKYRKSPSPFHSAALKQSLCYLKPSVFQYKSTWFSRFDFLEGVMSAYLARLAI